MSTRTGGLIVAESVQLLAERRDGLIVRVKKSALGQKRVLKTVAKGPFDRFAELRALE